MMLEAAAAAAVAASSAMRGGSEAAAAKTEKDLFTLETILVSVEIFAAATAAAV